MKPVSDEGFTSLRQQKSRKTDLAMVALLVEIATGQPVRVPLVEGQSARGLRTAISRVASSRGLSVETVEGNGFVAVRKAEESCTRADGAAAGAYAKHLHCTGLHGNKRRRCKMKSENGGINRWSEGRASPLPLGEGY